MFGVGFIIGLVQGCGRHAGMDILRVKLYKISISLGYLRVRMKIFNHLVLYMAKTLWCHLVLYGKGIMMSPENTERRMNLLFFCRKQIEFWNENQREW